MSEYAVSENPTPNTAPYALAIARWAVVMAVVFGMLAFGMGWLAGQVHVDSPIPKSPIPAQATGAPTAGGGPAGGPSNLPGALPPVQGGGNVGEVVDFRLASLDGGEISPADFRGKVVVVEFWATWCGPCRMQARYLEQLHQKLGDSIQILAVDAGEDEATVRNYVAKSPFPYPVLMDPTDALSVRYNIYGLPTIMILDPQGRITYKNVGVTPLNRLEKLVAAAQILDETTV